MRTAYEQISRDLMCEHWMSLADIDAPYVDAGLLEGWDRSHFICELPHKWQLSQLAIYEKRIVGYRIASGRGKISKYAHSHRTSISNELRSKGIGGVLLKRTIKTAKELGYIGMTGLRHPNNEGSKAFLQKTGWVFTGDHIRENELWAIIF